MVAAAKQPPSSRQAAAKQQLPPALDSVAAGQDLGWTSSLGETQAIERRQVCQTDHRLTTDNGFKQSTGGGGTIQQKCCYWRKSTHTQIKMNFICEQLRREIKEVFNHVELNHVFCIQQKDLTLILHFKSS